MREREKKNKKKNTKQQQQKLKSWLMFGWINVNFFLTYFDYNHL